MLSLAGEGYAPWHMTIASIISSRRQRRVFLLATCGTLTICIILVLGLAYYSPNTPVWTAFISLLCSIIGAGVFALRSALYLYYFFIDPKELAAKATLLSADIGPSLTEIATAAADYKIYVRTGRHFRAEILPVLVKRAQERRQPIRVEVVLLDPRDRKLCDRYADYRRVSSFDKHLWNTRYVRAVRFEIGGST